MPGTRVDTASPSLAIDNKMLDNVDHFPYLGSHLSSNVDIQVEVQYRLKCAGAAYGRLRHRVFQNRDIRTDTKMAVYKAVVLPTLLYASETWTTYRRHLKILEKFHQRCLRSILRISWDDYRTNLSVLEEGKTTSIEAIIIRNQLRWSGHLVRMPDAQLPKQMFYGQLKDGKRRQGGQMKRYKDLLKANLKKCDINTSTWETVAKDRPVWRRIIAQGSATFEAKRCADLAEKRSRRKERQQRPPANIPNGTTCPHCSRNFRAQIGLISHLRTHQDQ